MRSYRKKDLNIKECSKIYKKSLWKTLLFCSIRGKAQLHYHEFNSEIEIKRTQCLKD